MEPKQVHCLKNGCLYKKGGKIMARRGLAKRAARKKARRVYRSAVRKPKRAVAKILANFVGKSTYVAVRKKRRGRRGRRFRRR